MRPLLLALLLLAPLGARAQAPVGFPVVPERADYNSTAPECTTRAGTRVCRQFTADADGDGRLDFAVTRGGREVARWTAQNRPGTFSFAAFDAAGTLLVADFEDMSNGLGVRYWTVYVLPPGAATPAYDFGVAEFGARGGSFAAWRGRPVVWATEWMDGLDPTGRRGGGLYFTGRPFVIGAAGLEPATGVPLRARRYLNSFQDERGRSETTEPRRWLFDRRAEVRRADVAFDGCTRTETRGTVRTVAEAQGTWGPYLVLTMADGARYTYSRSDGDDGTPAITNLGTEGRLFPRAYHPADLAARLTGREVRIETCAPPGADYVRTRVLWL